MIKIHPENQKTFPQILKNLCEPYGFHQNQRLWNWLKHAKIITLCIQKGVFPSGKVLKWIQTEKLQKNLIFLKKSVDKWDAAWYYKQALERAGRKRLDDSAKQKHFVN